MLVVYLVQPGAKDPRVFMDYHGNRGARLTSLGVQAAQNVAERLAAYGVAPEGIYIAPYPAAWQTAQILAHRITRPRQEPVDTLALSDVFPGEDGAEFELRLKRFLTKFRKGAGSGAFVFVVDEPVADALLRAWGSRNPQNEALLSLEKADKHIRVLVRD